MMAEKGKLGDGDAFLSETLLEVQSVSEEREKWEAAEEVLEKEGFWLIFF